MSRNVKPKKIAVLGGGIAALAAVFELTSQSDWREHYEIDLYQIGWRLGGKGASGCNGDMHDRIEEHGLHVWMGFYENAFRLIRRCYDELAAVGSETFPTDWQKAFLPCDQITWEESVNGQKKFWKAHYKATEEVPGTSTRVPGPLGSFLMMVPRLCRHWRHMRRMALPDSASVGRERIHTLLQDASIVVRHLAYRICGMCGAHRAAESISRRTQTEDLARRLWLILDLTFTYLRGMVLDGVLWQGFDVIDEQDFRQWLRRHKAATATLDSTIVQGIYDFVFAYECGDQDRPRMSAAVAVRLSTRLLATCKGAVLYKMVSGMGESVFAPMYEVLHRRGVRFHFFRSVDKLALCDNGRSVASVTVRHQADAIADEYSPFVTVKGLKCWPSAPLYDQLVDGEELRAKAVDLESGSTEPRWKATILRAGVDFDEVILGISIGALPKICGELISARHDWQNMIHHIGTVQTQSCQMWLEQELSELDCPVPPTVLTSFSNPFSTWSAMDHLIDREGWLPDEKPRHIAYFCGPLREDNESPDDSDQKRSTRSWNDLRLWYESHIERLWPNASRIRDVSNGVPALPDRRHIYVRANGHPSDRYVLALPGTARYRLASDQSGFQNLYLAGDWVRTGLNLGCIEGAVISGMQVARAIGGRPAQILGERDLPWRRGEGIPER